MKNQMLSLGKVLNRSEQKLVTGGNGTLTYYNDGSGGCGEGVGCSPGFRWDEDLDKRIGVPGKCVDGGCQY